MSREGGMRMNASREWSYYEQLWRTHARMRAFALRVEQAVGIAREGASKGRMYMSLSGGKDSTALAGLLCEAGLAATQAVHASSGLNLPESLSTVEATARQLDLSLDVVDSVIDPWEMMAEIPRDVDISRPDVLDRLLRECSAGNLLVQYLYEQRFDGWHDGRRAAESKGRRWLARGKGPVSQSALDLKWTSLPLAWWSARDVWAFIVSRRLPVHPYYRRCCELGIDPETVRMDWLFAADWINAQGALYPIKRIYPAIWSRLILARPELAQYA